MRVIRFCWEHITAHAIEISWAAFFAFFFALVFDISAPDSRVRTLIRRMKNRSAEKSAESLRGRIVRLKFERDDYEAYLKSDKAIYLATFELIIGMLMALAAGNGISWIINDIGLTTHLPVFAHGPAIAFYGVTFILGTKAAAISSHATREKV